MTSEQILCDSMQHRGCGIRVASYAVGPQSWLPEACVWLETESGARKLWVRSFAHCFDADKLTFPNKLDADSWALGAARAIIDRAFEQFASVVMPHSHGAERSSASEQSPTSLPTRLFERLKRFRASN